MPHASGRLWIYDKYTPPLYTPSLTIQPINNVSIFPWTFAGQSDEADLRLPPEISNSHWIVESYKESKPDRYTDVSKSKGFSCKLLFIVIGNSEDNAEHSLFVVA